MIGNCRKEELNNPPSYDEGDILICTSDERRGYHNQLLRCGGFSREGSDDLVHAELLYSIGMKAKGHFRVWYTWRFEKWDGSKDCRLCTSGCKKEEVCAFFRFVGEGEIRND